MTLKGGTASACAACKYQRRKCTPECVLAPYFPAEQSRNFQNAHKLFGVSNITKILKDIDPIQHAEAMRSIKYQSNVREKFPVLGCLGVVRQLLYQIQIVEEELHAVHAQIEMYRQHHQISSIAEDVSQLELGMAPPTNALPLFNQVPPPQQYDNDNNNMSMAGTIPPVSMHMAGGYESSYLDSKENVVADGFEFPYLDKESVVAGGYESPYLDSKENVVAGGYEPPCLDSKENVVAWVQNPYTTNNNANNGNLMAMQTSDRAVASHSLAVHEHVQGYDKIHPFFDAIDDQSYIDSKEAYEQSSSSEESQSVERAENELKSAAACFSLTSVNGSSIAMS